MGKTRQMKRAEARKKASVNVDNQQKENKKEPILNILFSIGMIILIAGILINKYLNHTSFTGWDIAVGIGSPAYAYYIVRDSKRIYKTYKTYKSKKEMNSNE